MKVIKLLQTPAAVIRSYRGGYFLPVNVAAGGVACTINTRYNDLSEISDIITLAHYPKTVILLEYNL